MGIWINLLDGNHIYEDAFDKFWMFLQSIGSSEMLNDEYFVKFYCSIGLFQNLHFGFVKGLGVFLLRWFSYGS